MFQIGAGRQDFYEEYLVLTSFSIFCLKNLGCLLDRIGLDWFNCVWDVKMPEAKQKCRSFFSLRPKFCNHMLMTQPIAGTNHKVGKSTNLTTAWIWPLEGPSYFAPSSLLVKQTTSDKMSVVLMMGPSGARELWYGGFGSNVQCVQARASRHKCSSAPTC